MATIKGTKAADTLYGTSRDDRMASYEGNDILDAGAGNDALDGGRGNDMLFGGVGSDTYLFTAGDGHDVVREDVAMYGDVDTVKLAAGIDPSQVSLVNANGDLLIRLNATGDEVRVAGQFSSGGGIEQIQFTDGPTWGSAEINNAAWQVTGTAMGEVLFGHPGVDIIQGLGGDDQLIGMEGSDTYLFAPGDGHDVVR
ncbi:MAG: calcium-binding protein, partial [Telluria sp.]